MFAMNVFNKNNLFKSNDKAETWYYKYEPIKDIPFGSSNRKLK